MGLAALTLSGGEYAIHGTNPSQWVSRIVRLIRMHNEDIADLFERVDVGAGWWSRAKPPGWSSARASGMPSGFVSCTAAGLGGSVRLLQATTAARSPCERADRASHHVGHRGARGDRRHLGRGAEASLCFPEAHSRVPQAPDCPDKRVSDRCPTNGGCPTRRGQKTTNSLGVPWKIRSAGEKRSRCKCRPSVRPCGRRNSDRARAGRRCPGCPRRARTGSWRI